MVTPTPAPQSVPASPSLQALPGQLGSLSKDTFDWFRNDSTVALTGVGIAVALYLVFYGVRWSAVCLLGRTRDVATWRGFLGRIVRRTRSFFIAALAAYLVTHIIAPPGLLTRAIDVVFTIAFAIQGAYWLREIVLGTVERRAAHTDDPAGLESAMNIIRVLVNVVVWILAIILVLDNLGVNVTALVAGLGVGGIAIGLAAQGIFSDLFAALSILFDRPFRAGDTIRFGEVTGTVEAIGLKTTRLRATTGEQVIISNTKLLDQQIRNLKRIEARTAVMTFHLDLSAPTEALRQLPEMMAAVFAPMAHVALNRAHVTAATTISYEIELELTVADSSLTALLDAKQTVVLAAVDGFHRLGLRLTNVTPPREDQAARG